MVAGTARHLRRTCEGGEPEARRRTDTLRCMTARMTVAIANYNGGRHLEATLASLVAQTGEAIRVVLVDNASTDKSLEIAQRFSSAVSIVAYEDHVPVTANWNRCLQEQRSEYFALLHSDDVWQPGHSAAMFAALDAHPTACVAIGRTEILTSGNRRKPAVRSQVWKPGPLPEHERDQLLNGMFVFPCAWAWRSSVMQGMRFDESFIRVPDWEFWLRVFERPEPIICVPDALSGYRVHAHNDTFNSSTLRGMRDDELRALHRAFTRRGTENADRRRALRQADSRSMARILQVALRGQLRTASQLLRQLQCELGVIGCIRALIALGRPIASAIRNAMLTHLRRAH